MCCGDFTAVFIGETDRLLKQRNGVHRKDVKNRKQPLLHARAINGTYFQFQECKCYRQVK